MKKQLLALLLAISATLLLNGCIAAIGNDVPSRGGATLGQQLIDLKKAKEVGAITDAEYETQKAKLLGHK